MLTKSLQRIHLRNGRLLLPRALLFFDLLLEFFLLRLSAAKPAAFFLLYNIRKHHFNAADLEVVMHIHVIGDLNGISYHKHQFLLHNASTVGIKIK